MVRDFIYFDKEKIVSYGSQLLGGFTNSIVESVEKSKSKEKTIDINGSVGGSFEIGKDTSALLANILSRVGKLEVSAEGESSFSHTSNKGQTSIVSEERFLDHYQFELLRNALNEQNMLINLDDIKPHEWPNEKYKEKISPGDFVEFTCRVKLFDAKHLQSVAISLEQIMAFIQQLMISNMLQADGIDEDSKRQLINNIAEGDTAAGYAIMQQALGDGMEPVIFNAMIELMKDISEGSLSTVPTQFYIRHKNQSRTGSKFIAPIRESNLTEPKNEMIFKYGYEPDQDWKVLAQICKIPKKENSSLSNINMGNMDTGSFDQIIGEITEYFTAMSTQIGLHSMIKHPDISINLVALYR